jgi:hypothetical protein
MNDDEFDDVDFPHPSGARRHGEGGSSRYRPFGGGAVSGRDRSQRPRGSAGGVMSDTLAGFPFGLPGSEKVQIKLNKPTPIEELLPFFEVDLSAQ